MKKIIVAIFCLLWGGSCVLQAQTVSTDSNAIKKTDNNNSSNSKNQYDKNKKLKEPNYNEDSVIMLKARIVELENTIQQLTSDNESLKNKPTSSPNKGSAKQVDSLKQEVQRLNNVLTKQIITTFGQHLTETNADNRFCFAVLESPLYYKYDQQRVQRSLDMAKTIGYDKKGNKYNWIYNIYYVLLVNYNDYNQELVEYVDGIIKQFETGAINRSFESKKFESWLRTSKYFKVRGTGEYGGDRHIFFLDFQIERLRELFKNDTDFKKDNFRKIRQKL